jgi:hypothetical protein
MFRAKRPERERKRERKTGERIREIETQIEV